MRLPPQCFCFSSGSGVLILIGNDLFWLKGQIWREIPRTHPAMLEELLLYFLWCVVFSFIASGVSKFQAILTFHHRIALWPDWTSSSTGGGPLKKSGTSVLHYGRESLARLFDSLHSVKVLLGRGNTLKVHGWFIGGSFETYTKLWENGHV